MLVQTLKEAKEQLCIDTKFQRYLGKIRKQEELSLSSQQFEQEQQGKESASDQPKQLSQQIISNNANSLIYSIKTSKKQHEIIQYPQPFQLQQQDQLGNLKSQKQFDKIESKRHSDQSFCLSQSSLKKNHLPKIISPMRIHKIQSLEFRQQTAIKIRPKYEQQRNGTSIEVIKTQTQGNIFQDKRDKNLDWQSSRRFQKNPEELNFQNARNQSKKQNTSSNPFSIHIKQTANQMKASQSSQQTQNLSNISAISYQHRVSQNILKSKQESMTTIKNQNDSSSSQMTFAALENSQDNLKKDRKIVQFKKGSFQSTSISQESSVETEGGHIRNHLQHPSQLSLPRYYKQSSNQSKQQNDRVIVTILDKKELKNLINKIITLVRKLKGSQQSFSLKDACSQEQNNILTKIIQILDNSKGHNISHNSSITTIQTSFNEDLKKNIIQRQHQLEEDIQYQVLKQCQNVQILRHLIDILENTISEAAKINSSCSSNSSFSPPLRKPQKRDNNTNQPHYPLAMSNITQKHEPLDWIAGVGSQEMKIKKGIIWDVVDFSQTNQPFYQTLLSNERQ